MEPHHPPQPAPLPCFSKLPCLHCCGRCWIECRSRGPCWRSWCGSGGSDPTLALSYHLMLLQDCIVQNQACALPPPPLQSAEPSLCPPPPLPCSMCSALMLVGAKHKVTVGEVEKRHKAEVGRLLPALGQRLYSVVVVLVVVMVVALAFHTSSDNGGGGTGACHGCRCCCCCCCCCLLCQC